MKTLMFSLTFVVALVLYGAGFFVPETQGIESIVDGHVVLKDAEMAQLTGGSQETNEPHDMYPPDLTLPPCITTQLKDCNKVPGKTISYQKYICVDCEDNTEKQYKIDNGAPFKVNVWCKNRYYFCGYVYYTWRTFTSCITDLNQQCGNYM